VSHCKFLNIFFLFIVVSFFSFCTKIKSTDIGADLIPEIDNINTFDTSFEVVAVNSISPDSLLPRISRDQVGDVGQFMLGYVSHNPQFGTTIASIFLELKPTGYPYKFENVPDSLYLDSVVLCLKYRFSFGDTNALQSVTVQKITETLKPDSAYQTNKIVAYSQVIGTKQFVPASLNDSLITTRERTSNQLRIRLNNDFGNELLKIDTAGLSPYKNDSLFRNYFKGFAIVPETGGSGSAANGLMSFAISDTATYLRFYYRYTKNGRQDTSAKNFKFNSNGALSASVNHIERNYSGSEMSQHLGAKPGGDSLIYIQAAPGTYSLLRIPGLNEFKSKKGNVMIHLAQLSMDEAQTPGSQSNMFYAPLYMYPEIFDTTLNSFYPFFADGFVNGNYDNTTFGGFRKYNFDNTKLIAHYDMNLTRHVQSIITRNLPNMPIKLSAPKTVRYNDLYLTLSQNSLATGNVVLGGGNHSSKKMKLRVIYSKL